MIEADGIVGILLLVLWIYCIFDVIASDADLIRSLPKTLWLIIVLMIPDIGAIAWLLLGRPEKAGWRPGDTAMREDRWAGRQAPRGSAGRSADTDSIAERDRLIAQWDAEEEARRQAVRDQVDAETTARKRAAEEKLIEARRLERQNETLKAMEMQLPQPDDESPTT